MEVVLIHSGVTDSREWDEMRPLLEQAGNRVLAPDLPGYGSAPLEPGEHSLAEVVLGFFEGKAALVGTSFGGRAVLEAALAAPERVEVLVLVNANPFGWSAEVERIGEEEEALFEAGRYDAAAALMVRSWLVGPNREPEQVDESLRARVHAMQMQAYELRANVDASLQRSETMPLGAIDAPTLVVRGALDWPDVNRAAERFVDEIPNAREVVIDGVAHLPALERPDELARVIVDFLATQS
jgi:pimeloyl-ACP methyl ester carboxylesterase